MKTLEIIQQLNPKYWLIENPQTGLLVKQDFMKGLPFVDASYCKYGMPYRKQTRFWTNIPNLKLETCNKDCDSMIGNRHIGSCGTNGQGHIRRYTNRPYSKREMYAIPPRLIENIIKHL
jgi:hypothetical protein